MIEINSILPLGLGRENMSGVFFFFNVKAMLGDMLKVRLS